MHRKPKTQVNKYSYCDSLLAEESQNNKILKNSLVAEEEEAQIEKILKKTDKKYNDFINEIILANSHNYKIFF